MSCVLRASGQGFDVEAFLAGSPFAGAAVPLGKEAGAGRDGQDPRSVSGFRLELSPAGGDDLQVEIEEAIAFLDEHEEELRRLGSFRGVDEVCLTFGVQWRQLPAQTDHFPPELLWRSGALDIALEITHFSLPHAES